MVAALLAAVVTSATASPLPIIITTESSPVCTAVRERIAPALARMMYEDRMMAQQHPSGHAPQHGAAINDLALNWIKMDELLNPDTFFKSDNPAEKARMESLREKLQKVADDENNALNVLSGSYYTAALEELEQNGSVIGAPTQGLPGPAPLPEIANDTGSLEAEYRQREVQTQQAEVAIYPELKPIMDQCIAPSPTPSASP